MFKVFVGVVLGVILTFPTTHTVLKMEWNHIKQVSSVVVDSITK